MEGTFLWLATFFSKHYQPFLEKRCKVKVRINWDKNSLSVYLKKGRMAIFYALRCDKKGICIYRSDRALRLCRYLEPPVIYSHKDALRAFFFLMEKVMREAICISISSILNHHKIFATVIAPGEPIEVIAEADDKSTLAIVPLIKGNKIQFDFRRVSGEFADKVTPIGGIEVPLSKFRPQEIAKAAEQLIGLLTLREEGLTVKYKNYIVQDPEICFGKPVIKGTRIPVYIIVGMLAEGIEVKEIAENYLISEEEVRAAALYALNLLFKHARREVLSGEKISPLRVRKLLLLAADIAEKTKIKAKTR
jgi:uncharacterized protein (DUF433 family)